MRTLGLLIRLTLKEVIRSYTYGFLVIFAIISTASSSLFLAFSLQEQEKFFKDISLACITLFSVILAALLGASQIHTDFETKTIYNIFTNPVRKWAYIVGRFLGIAILIGLGLGLMAGVFYLNLGFQNIKIFLFDTETTFSLSKFFSILYRSFVSNLEFIKVFISIFLQSLIICALSTALSSLFSVPMALTGSIVLFIVGHLTHFITQIAFHLHPVIGYFLWILLLWIPNFENFNVADAVSLGHLISLEYLGWLMIYSCLSVLFFLAVTYKNILIKTRDL